MTLKPWRLVDTTELADARIFTLHLDTAVSPRTGEEREFVRVDSPTWVNIVPVTTTGEVVLVRQWRHGIREFTLEIPGGLVDLGEDPGHAAAREVREETGYAGDDPVEIGRVHANPAFLDNVTYTFLIENCCLVGEQQLDPGEDVEVVTAPLADIPGLVARGEIRHSLVICGFWWLAQRRPDLLALGPGR